MQKEFQDYQDAITAVGTCIATMKTKRDALLKAINDTSDGVAKQVAADMSTVDTAKPA
jgi:hypothetical protein